MREALARVGGMILVTGPTGSGKTTTLYAALAEINGPDRKIITVEDPVEYRLPGINQVQVHEKIELGFERVLRSALRQDPDVILVGEMRDQTTAEIGLRAALTGHLVLSTLHTSDAASTPIRLLDMGVPAYMVAMSLHLVVAQRLVRMVCEECSAPHEPSAQESAWLLHVAPGAAGATANYRRGLGCSRCNGTGYAGRSAVYEMLEMTQPLVQAANGGSPVEFVRLAREQMADADPRSAMPSAWSAEGRTTIEEATRISVQLETRLRWRSSATARATPAASCARARSKAPNAAAVADQLSGGGNTPVRIEAATGTVSASPVVAAGWRLGARLGRSDVLLFSRQLHSLLKAGIPITRALGGLQDSAGPAMAGVIQQTRESLESGNALSLSMARQHGVFSAFYIAMVRIGELTGRLDEVFLRLFHHLAFEKLMRDQVRTALRYPSFVVAVMAAAIVIINLFVIPAFQKVFDGFGAELPLMTRILIGFSHFMIGRLAVSARAAPSSACVRLSRLGRAPSRAATPGTASCCACRSPARS